MPTYKCPTLGDCDRANSGEIFTRAPGEDLHCPGCGMLLQQLPEAVQPARIPKAAIAAAAVAVLAVVGAGGGYYVHRLHAASAGNSASTAPAAVAQTAPAGNAGASAVQAGDASSGGTGGIAPSDAEISAQRKDGDAKLQSGDVAGAATAGNEAAAKEMVKVAIADLSQGKLDDAEKELNDAGARDPKQSLVYYNLGVLRLKQGRTDDALKEFEASFLNGFTYFDALDRDPDLDGIRRDPRFVALLKKYRAPATT